MSFHEDTEMENQYDEQRSIKNAIEYQMDLLNAKSGRLNREKKVYRKVSELMGYGFFYENFVEKTEFEVGDWDVIFGYHQDTYENIQDFLKNLDQCEKIKVVKSRQMEENTTYREMQVLLDNKKVWVGNTTWTEVDENGQAVERISCFRNVSNFKQQNEEMEFLAFFDTLTGLYNRNHFVKELGDILEKEREEKTQDTISVISLGIHDFKKINDGMGMVAGDEVLQDISRRLQAIADEYMLLARFSGGEFFLGVTNASGKRSAENIFTQISNQLRDPVLISGHEPVHLNFSVGVAEYPEAGTSVLDLIQNAQIVRKSAESAGRNNIKFYDYQIVNSFIEKLEMEKQLKEAVENEEFELFYQPQYDIHGKKLRGAETLLRWRREDGSFVPNDIYIPMAEQNGEIIRIGRWVTENAIGFLAKLENELDFEGVLSINVSTVQLKQDDFVPHLMGVIEETGINPQHLEIEITESVVMEDLELIVGKFRVLREQGIKVSLDDFGTGFSSLTYLKDLPIDTLKIDKSFIDSVTKDASTNIITQSVVDMVRQLGLETVAEGVETEEQYQFLEDIQCDNIQGFLLGKPMPEDQFIEVCKKEQMAV